MAESYLPYEEPGVEVILVQASFVVLLNAINSLLDRAIYCGIIGQILLGVAWGTPGSKWLPETVESVFGQLGYLGLILIVYEGGLSTSLTALKANLALSSCVALTGIGLPIGLSFILVRLVSATKLQAFAAGAALCSTSLGTTFTVLGTSGLVTSRLGVVLTSAAMLDDVVGLIMVQVISNLGSGHIGPVTIVRPIIVSFGLVAFLFLICHFVLRHLVSLAKAWLQVKPTKMEKLKQVGKIWKAGLHFVILFGMVAGATYAGTSNLFAAYLAGVVVSWLDGLLDIPNATGVEIYHEYYQAVVERILKPFFFASIGFSIPISQMFEGSVVWRGFVYTILMSVGKLACGIWLLPLPSMPSWHKKNPVKAFIRRPSEPKPLKSAAKGKDRDREDPPNGMMAGGGYELDDINTNANKNTSSSSLKSISAKANDRRPRSKESRTPSKASTTKARSLYPASMLGSAMVARGEIGFLISSLAESYGIFADPSANHSKSEGPSRIYLIVTWAIMLCTIIGPISVGLLVRRVRRLQQAERERADGRADPLGKWGVI